MNGTLYLCNNVELDPKYNYTIDFNDKTAQSDYFRAKLVHLIPNDSYSYIRENKEITVKANIDDLFGVNYLYYKNNAKTYYAFITRKEYVSPTATRLFFDIDVMQTFMFDYSLEHSFVEREHQDRAEKISSTSAKVIFNRQKENIEYGDEYLTNKSTIEISPNILFTYILKKIDVETSPYNRYAEDDIIQPYEVNFIASYDNNKSSSRHSLYFKYKNEVKQFNVNATDFVSDINVLQIFISRIPPAQMKLTGPDNDILEFVENEGEQQHIICSYEQGGYVRIYRRETGSIYSPFFIMKNKCQKIELNSFVDKNIPLESFDINAKPKLNNEPKIRTYPYDFSKLMFGNNELTIRNETDSNVAYVYQSLSMSGSAALFIDEYENGSQINNNKLITNQLPNFISLSTSEWQKYELENKSQRLAGFINTGTSAALGVGGAVIGAMTGNPLALLGTVGIGASAIMKIGSQLAKEKDIKALPDDPKQFNGDTYLNSVLSEYSPIQMHYFILPEFKKKLFNYFYHYGYACNDFKKPNLKSRYYFNFIKTIDANIKSNIDSEYRDIIKSIYDEGITIWHYRDKTTFKGVNNYDFENAEMSLLGGN